MNWGKYAVYMAEPGFIAVKCLTCERSNIPGGSVWDQFPYFEGRVDFKYLYDWMIDHKERYNHG